MVSTTGFLGRKLSALCKKLEVTFGVDIDQDGEVGSVRIALLSMVAVVFVAISAFAGDLSYKFAIDNTSGTTVLGVDSNDNTFVVGDFSVTGDTALTGAVSLTGALSVDGAITVDSNSQTVTNGQTIVLSPGINVITPSGLANGYTTVVAVANATDKYEYQVIVSSTATNVLGIPDSANLRLTAAFNGSANDYMSLLGYSTNYIETGRSDN